MGGRCCRRMLSLHVLVQQGWGAVAREREGGRGKAKQVLVFEGFGSFTQKGEIFDCH